MNKPIFRMSESGKCPKALSAKLLGYEPTPAPEWLGRQADEGKWHEERIKRELQEDWWLVDAEQKEVMLDFPSFTLVGHIDGTIIKEPTHATKEDLDAEGNGKWQLLEIKSMSQFEFDRWMREGFKGFLQYASQVSCYMEATGLNECLYIVKNRNNGYEDRRVLTEKPTHMTKVIAHLTDVTNHALGNQLVPKDFAPQSFECRRCEYRHLCIPEPRELTPYQEAELNYAVEKWREGQALIKTGKEAVDKAREILEEHTRATNVLKWRYSGLAIQLIHTKRESYERRELLRLFTPEQLAPALKVVEYDSLRIEDLTKEEDK